MLRHSEKRRVRRKTRRDAAQYSLFAAAPAVGAADLLHLRRQAQLCHRLAGTLHQRELLELLARLAEEFEAQAARLEARAGGDAGPHRPPPQESDLPR